MAGFEVELPLVRIFHGQGFGLDGRLPEALNRAAIRLFSAVQLCDVADGSIAELSWLFIST